MNNVISVIVSGYIVASVSSTGIASPVSVCTPNYCYNNATATLNNSISLQLSESQQFNYAVLKEIEDLPDNWNENGAPSFSRHLLNICRHLVSKLRFAPEIFPVANGSIQFEYIKSDGSYLECGISEEKIHIFKVNSDRQKERVEYLADEYAIEKIVKEVELFHDKHLDI